MAKHNVRDKLIELLSGHSLDTDEDVRCVAEELIANGVVVLPFPVGATFRHNLDLRLPQEARDYYELYHNLAVAIRGTRHGDGERVYFPLDSFRVGDKLWENQLIKAKDGAG